MARKLSIQAVNELSYKDFISTFANVVEHTSLCAAAVCTKAPFSSSESFVSEICRFIDSLPDDAKAGILRSYQDLFDRWESLSSESQREQTEASIRSLGAEEIKLLKSYTRLYKEKFGFPLVICARLNNKETILERIRERLSNDSYQELNNGIKEVKDIMVLRVNDVVNSETSKI